MPKLPAMRSGAELKAYDRSVPFSFWPTGQATPRPPVQPLLFALDPWVIMRHAVSQQVTMQASKLEALAYIEQARDFYTSALNSPIGAAKPVQLYYSFLNVAKAFILCRGIQDSLSSIRHGINEFIGPGGDKFNDAKIQFWTSPNQGKLQAFDEFMRALNAPRIANNHIIPLPELVPQVVPGHRLWAIAATEKERFIALQRIQFIDSRNPKRSWLRLYLFQDDVRRLGYTQDDVLTLSGLSPDFRKVKCSEKVDGRPLICMEQVASDTYGRHAVDLALTQAGRMRGKLWATVASASPYRRYYLYLCPITQQASRVSQIASIYALTFFLGSVTRYRPNDFRELLEGPYGPRVEDFISGQPPQFIYLMASEFERRDITKPAIV